MDSGFLTVTWPWWVGGLAVGFFVFLFLIVTGNALGVSTGYVNLCQLAFPKPKGSEAYYEKEVGRNSFNWRFFFLVGILIGGGVAAVLGGHLDPSMNRGFESLASVFPGYSMYAVLLVGGMMVGFGARLAGGCTSGHSIQGMALLAYSSFVATLCFMAAAILSSNVVFRFGARLWQ
jgi:hypothetical protein